MSHFLKGNVGTRQKLCEDYLSRNYPEDFDSYLDWVESSAEGRWDHNKGKIAFYLTKEEFFWLFENRWKIERRNGSYHIAAKILFREELKQRMDEA